MTTLILVIFGQIWGFSGLFHKRQKIKNVQIQFQSFESPPIWVSFRFYTEVTFPLLELWKGLSLSEFRSSNFKKVFDSKIFGDTELNKGACRVFLHSLRGCYFEVFGWMPILEEWALSTKLKFGSDGLSWFRGDCKGSVRLIKLKFSSIILSSKFAKKCKKPKNGVFYFFEFSFNFAEMQILVLWLKFWGTLPQQIVSMFFSLWNFQFQNVDFSGFHLLKSILFSTVRNDSESLFVRTFSDRISALLNF